jgi:hypothetical protein
MINGGGGGGGGHGGHGGDGGGRGGGGGDGPTNNEQTFIVKESSGAEKRRPEAAKDAKSADNQKGKRGPLPLPSALGSEALAEATAEETQRQGLTLVHLSAQPEPLLTQNTQNTP